DYYCGIWHGSASLIF
nr:immunoglobulin light chain junction region [Macaca mulatta]MOX70532.1 immunoglobulin light chain junction region [Macaca mulatta]MOX71109.1 immunoglobulin light chain junction region [Macaca mulatta]MOX71842.1 immunoglobulin light chain junction region [Macaca mulatta]MOX72289.1 immunoglobulin light chain junction region [Macaca mulatta]